MKRDSNIAFIVVSAIVLGGVAYFVLPISFLFYFMLSQMRVGQRYMDSITEKDIPVWIDRTQKYLQEYEPNSIVGAYGYKDKPVPPELKSLKILRIDITRDSVYYVWVGGLDHTFLKIEKTTLGSFRFIARYNDYNSKLIWPKGEDANQPH